MCPGLYCWALFRKSGHMLYYLPAVHDETDIFTHISSGKPVQECSSIAAVIIPTALSVWFEAILKMQMIMQSTPALVLRTGKCQRPFRPAGARISQTSARRVLTRYTPAKNLNFQSFVEIISGKSSAEDAGIYMSQTTRDEYSYDDVSFYYEYMGLLAIEQSYDNMNKMLEKNHPIDVILHLASRENDIMKVSELLVAGADITATDLDGKTALDLTTNPEIKALLKEQAAKRLAHTS